MLASPVQRSENGRDAARVPHELAYGLQGRRVIVALRPGPRRRRELRAAIGGISDKVLTETLPPSLR